LQNKNPDVSRCGNKDAEHEKNQEQRRYRGRQEVAQGRESKYKAQDMDLRNNCPCS
jgi:hypothetical protein